MKNAEIEHANLYDHSRPKDTLQTKAYHVRRNIVTYAQKRKAWLEVFPDRQMSTRPTHLIEEYQALVKAIKTYGPHMPHSTWVQMQHATQE